MTTEKAIENLMNSPSYKKLIDMIGGLNVISECGMEMQETKHSGLLAKLLDPESGLCKKSGIGNGFIQKFITDIFAYANIDFSHYGRILEDVRVKTEWIFPNNKRVDIVLYSPKNRLVIFIENKVLAEERDFDYSDPNTRGGGSGQLKDYIDGFESDWRFDGYKDRDSHGEYKNCLFLFLTPNEKMPTNKAWQPIGYIFVLETLKYILPQISNAKVRSWIEDYIKFIRRNIVSDRELKQVIREIYSDEDNRIAIGKLFAEKINIKNEIASEIYKILRQNQSAWHLEDITAPRGKSLIITFKTERSKEIDADILYHAEYESAIDDILHSKFVGWSELKISEDEKKSAVGKERIAALRKRYENPKKTGTRILMQNGIEILVKDAYDEVNGIPKSDELEKWLNHYINDIIANYERN